MTKMSDVGSVSGEQGSVCVHIQGDVNYKYVKDMVDGCAAGQHCDCDCDCDKMMADAQLAVDGTDGDVSIHIKHPGVSPELMQQNLMKCGMDVSGRTPHKTTQAPAK
ncbi:hypothetical protein OOT46_24590 [Aquabacterium sp. A7-Y]|uniref:hypothetical protein n=1 Tax=Aquabacterium sp. A7-Y TaxID=1349605 RepID=UPI00223CC908|nr:hypothetical protein [Aquabacterium sp. A7-Y]MCW7541005.1 hypothetical protein [Aquabacterium sp. A7-Y]